MKRWAVLILARLVLGSAALNLEYLDPAKLQTRASPAEQQRAAARVIAGYLDGVSVRVDSALFEDSKDAFEIESAGGQLSIRASSGVAALWGFNHYLKRYCGAHEGWQVRQLRVPRPLPAASERVVANDRFRYYQNVCTASYSFAWWGAAEWRSHVHWMAMNGINLALAPVAQEAAWKRVFKRLNISENVADDHFTGPAFLAWLRMGNFHSWLGSLPQSWHDVQQNIQNEIVTYMYSLGIVPIFPAFNGHVPRALAKIFPEELFYSVGRWMNFDNDYCCGLFLDPTGPLFSKIGKMFLEEVVNGKPSHIYHSDPFNELQVLPWSLELIMNTARGIFQAMTEIDESSVWLLQSWMFVNNPYQWPKSSVKMFLNSVPEGRILVLDLQAEQNPKFNEYEMYYGQPFIWCMLHNFGGNSGMFGKVDTINEKVNEARVSVNSTMIGIGLTPEGINQNYAIYDFMLETAWRKRPADKFEWVTSYAQRRYGCNATALRDGWVRLFDTIYNFNGTQRIDGLTVVTTTPTLYSRPKSWFRGRDIFYVLEKFVFAPKECWTPGYYHDLVDITREALHYRATQLYVNVVGAFYTNSFLFSSSIDRFLDAMGDMQNILATNRDFSVMGWLDSAKKMAKNPEEEYLYRVNARNQITLWGPNGEISDYACKQWAEVFQHYYIPRWRMFLASALDAKRNREPFDEARTQQAVRMSVERPFIDVVITPLPREDPVAVATSLYKKWVHADDLPDLPLMYPTVSAKRFNETRDFSTIRQTGGASFNSTVASADTDI